MTEELLQSLLNQRRGSCTGLHAQEKEKNSWMISELPTRVVSQSLDGQKGWKRTVNTIPFCHVCFQ